MGANKREMSHRQVAAWIALGFSMLANRVLACPIPSDTLLETGFEMRSGVIRYVATNGNDANAGSAQSPWRHLQYAADALLAAFYRVVDRIARINYAGIDTEESQLTNIRVGHNLEC